MGLKELREQRLLSQRELAAKSGVSQTTIVNIETGKIRPHPSTLRKLADALGVEPAQLAAHLGKEGAGPTVKPDPAPLSHTVTGTTAWAR